MFDHGSRYAKLSIKTYQTADGGEIKYVARRFLPTVESHALLTEVRVTQGDRLDLIASRTLGDALAYWRIADASGATNPLRLTDELRVVLTVPVPEF